MKYENAIVLSNLRIATFDLFAMFVVQLCEYVCVNKDAICEKNSTNALAIPLIGGYRLMANR